MTMTEVEVSVRGQWRRVPALYVNGIAIITEGRLTRIARVLDEEWLQDELQDPQSCLSALRSKGSCQLRADIFTFSQKLPATAPKYSFHLEWDSVAVIRLTSFKAWWDKLPQESRKNVRRSQKRGVEVKVRALDDDLVREIVRMFEDSPLRQGRPFTHFAKTFDQVKKDQSSHLGRCDFICAYFANELIGMAKIIYAGDTASILHFLPKASQQDKRPANALISKVVEVCANKGITYIVYGMFKYGNKRDSSLLEFKVRNGFEEIVVPRFYVPLTAWGSLCLKLKFHRGLIGLLPNRIINIALSARRKWYIVGNSLQDAWSARSQSALIHLTKMFVGHKTSTQSFR